MSLLLLPESSAGLDGLWLGRRRPLGLSTFCPGRGDTDRCLPTELFRKSQRTYRLCLASGQEVCGGKLRDTGHLSLPFPSTSNLCLKVSALPRSGPQYRPCIRKGRDIGNYDHEVFPVPVAPTSWARPPPIPGRLREGIQGWGPRGKQEDVECG